MSKFVVLLIIFSGIIFAEPVEIKSVEVFENILKQPNRLLVFDLYADWCRPCKLLDPILTEISKENEAVQFYRINVDSLPQIQRAFQANSIPFVAFFKNGQYLDRLIGLHRKETYLKAIEILDK
jgi:thioredoxin 1